MSKVGKSLRQVLDIYGISQSKLATTMETTNANVTRWFHGKVDPTGETILNIVAALKKIEPTAADQFVQLYLGDMVGERVEKQPKSALEKLRINLGLSQEQVAKAVDVDIVTVNNWELGREKPKLTIRQFKALLSILQCSVDELPDDLSAS